MQPVTQEPGTRESDTAAAAEARRRAERHRAIGIAAVAAAVLYQGTDDRSGAPAQPR
jgi:hypothetical protein